MTILDGFKIKPLDLEPIYDSWPNAPKFVGNPKKDPPVDDWLRQIRAGCVQRNVPREYWHKVAQHYLGDRAKARLTELKKVMAQVHGGRYSWNWDKFKIAMRNMGWNVDPNETQEVKVQTKRWWLPQKKEVELPSLQQETATSMKKTASSASTTSSSSTTKPPPMTRSNSFWINRKASTDKGLARGAVPPVPPVPPMPPVPVVETKRPRPSRAATVMDSMFHSSTKKEDDKDSKDQRPSSQKARSETMASNATPTPTRVTPVRGKTLPATPTVTADANDEMVTTVTHAPVWLLNACNALDFLQNEHPKVMSTLSAILITAGSIPSIPAISAGAGGALLASGAAQAVGAIAVGVGSWLKSQHEMSQGSRDGSEKSC